MIPADSPHNAVTIEDANYMEELDATWCERVGNIGCGEVLKVHPKPRWRYLGVVSGWQMEDKVLGLFQRLRRTLSQATLLSSTSLMSVVATITTCCACQGKRDI